MASNKNINIYTEGACAGNPGPGGWGVYIDNNGEIIELSGNESETTNNRMELQAIIEALSYFSDISKINLFTDSKYVIDGANSWMVNWKKNGWQTAQKKPVKNKDLWIKLDTLIQTHKLTWNWVKGHDGNFGNERADYLATSAI